MMKGTRCEVGWSFWSIEEYESMVESLMAMQHVCLYVSST